MNSAGLSRIASKAAGPIGLIGAVGGFIADVLAPLGEFAPLVAGISLIGAIIFGALTIRESRNNRHDIWDTAYSGGLFVSISSVLIFSIWSLILGAGPERGYLAENIDPIAQIQGQLLGIQEDVTEIKETTTQTAEDVEVLATAQAQGFADIQAAFANLQQSQTIIENPTTPQEFYSNARLHQLKGNTAEAVNAYEGYLQFGLEYVDPVQDYADLLKATEGIVRAREIVNTRLQDDPGSLVTDLVAISMLDTVDERISRLEALTSRAPNFGPAFLALGQAYDNKLGQGSGFRDLTEKFIRTYSALKTLEETQEFSRYYIDKNRAIGAFDLAMRSLETREGLAANNPLLTQPEVLISFNSTTGVTFVFIIADIGPELLVGFDDPNNLRSTGANTVVGGTTYANASLPDVPLEIGDHILYYKYTDRNGTESPLFEKSFSVTPIVANVIVQPGDFTSGTSNVTVITFAYQRSEEEGVEFFWGLSEDDITNSASDFPYNMTSFMIEGLTSGDYTLYIRGEGEDGEVLGPNSFPFTVQ